MDYLGGAGADGLVLRRAGDKASRRFTVSAGEAVVAVSGLSESLSKAIRRADAALYRAKRSGRDKVCVADAA
jgi:PleD family two-component response regulator